MKLCKDCKYYSQFSWYCKHDKAIMYFNPVNGKADYWFAEVMREGRECGPNAKLFEPKESFSTRFFNGIFKY